MRAITTPSERTGH
jgi:hypothetical protein